MRIGKAFGCAAAGLLLSGCFARLLGLYGVDPAQLEPLAIGGDAAAGTPAADPARTRLVELIVRP